MDRAAIPDLIVLEDHFSAADGLLHEQVGTRWKRAHGDSLIAVRSGKVFIPGDAPVEAYVVAPFSRPVAEGSILTASLVLRVDSRGDVAAPSTGVVFQFASADGRQRRARLAVRINADGSCQLGVTAKSSQAIVWAKEEISLFEDHEIALRYEPGAGCVSLWIDAAHPGAEPDAQARLEVPDGLTPAQASLQQSGKAGAPEVRLAQLVVTARASGVSSVVTSEKAPAPVVALRPAVAPPAKGFRVFLLMGQSNMAGRGSIEALDRAENPRILAMQADGGWTRARDPLHWDKPTVAGVGPGMAFARALLPALPVGETIGLIPAAFGGTSLKWWKKDFTGSQRWPNGKTYFDNAITLAQTVPASDLAGILWIQGESDASAAQQDQGAGYRRDLHALIADLRADLHRPDLPFIAATLKPWRPEEATVLNTVYLALPKEVANAAVVNTRAPELAGRLRNKVDDEPHYDAASARLLGELMAREAKPLLKLRP